MPSNYTTPTRSRPGSQHDAASNLSDPRHAPSPLRHTTSIATNSSTAHLNSTNFTFPNRTGSSGLSHHTRGLSEAQVPGSPRAKDFWTAKEAGSAPTSPDKLRAALRPIQQGPGASPPPPLMNSPTLLHSPPMLHSRTQSYDSKMMTSDGATSPTIKSGPYSLAISRADSARAPIHDRSNRNSTHFASSTSHMEKSDLEGLQKSTTGHLRTLSKFAENGVDEDFTIKSPEQEVVGLHGRRRLVRTMNGRDKPGSANTSKFTTSWQATKWMDQQRQFLQAYEYLCHIGEAKEWIEDIVHKTIPPIVQLEEALRDGVTLAEVVQALHPERPIRIFHHERLQFRHSDNIALFFRFLAEVELPELFRFELVDLYEKKNIPKVIYCIHALSWLLFRTGVVDFRIGNLVGQLQFEDHELEAMQKGLDKAGISMPNFSAMGANFGEPEPEPEPIETEDERIERELAENEAAIEDFQAQIRGFMVRIKLGDTMQDLWDAEEALMDLQSRIRGDFARQIAAYRLDMQRFAVQLQAAARGYTLRARQSHRQQHWENQESQIIALQSLIRARKARASTQQLRSDMKQHEGGVRNLQAAIRGAFARWDVGDQYHAAQQSQGSVQKLQAAIRGALARGQVDRQREDTKDAQESIELLQAAIRGAHTRRRVGSQREETNKAQQSIKLLQAAIRGASTRSKVESQLKETDNAQQSIKLLQAAIRGAFARGQIDSQLEGLKEAEGSIRLLQAAIKAASTRDRIGSQLQATSEAQDSIRLLQAAIRAASARTQVDRQIEETKEVEVHVPSLQASIRAMLERKRHADNAVVFQQQSRAVETLQAAMQGLLQRKRIERIHGSLQVSSDDFIGIQSTVRGSELRASLRKLRRSLKAQTPSIVAFQASIRAARLRGDIGNVLLELEDEEDAVEALQTFARGHMYRKRYSSDVATLYAQEPAIVELQALSRAYVQRQQTYDVLFALGDEEDAIVDLQSMVRSLLLQRDIGLTLAQLEEEEEVIAEMQAAIRGNLVRHHFAEKQRFYKENMEKVVKVQSFIRGRQQGQAYKSLTSGANPPVGTVKNFVHLLNDSDFDFDEELEFERLRKTVVQRVRQNEMAEQYVDQLDIKIALLVKNKITLDEVVKHQKHFGGHVGSLLNNKEISSKDPFDLKALNKNSRKKLEHYQELFFVLQTQPHYLAKLFRKLKDQGMVETEGKRIELLMMGLFGFAQKRREEYYLLKLVACSIKEEAEKCASLQDYQRANFFWGRLLAAYLRSPRDRKYFRDLYGPLVRESIFENQELDLESDPMQIYRALINNEELSTGQRSRKDPDIPREQAIKDPQTRETFIAHLQDLRDICDHFFVLLEETLNRMPYGIRYIAQQSYETLCTRFPEEDQQHILQAVGHWLWKSYLLPALTQPEMWGVIDRGLSPLHRRNLGEVGKVLGQVYAGRLFGGEHVYLQPLNTWVGEALDRMHELLAHLIDVRDAEQQFEMDENNDLFARTKPTLYIKMSDIFAIHQMVVTDLPTLCPQDDPLREIIRELGSAKSNENEMMGVGSNEISLQLTPKYHEQHDPDADIKSLFMETKRLILYIIRIQSGSNLLDIMIRPITAEDDEKWLVLLDEEVSNQTHSPRASASAYAPSTIDEEPASTLLDITTMSYAEVKSTALENILVLERAGRLSRHNHYQDLLNAIALDIRTKHRRRIQRTRELEGVRATLNQLENKACFLDEQLQSYNDYIEQAMITLQSKKGKKRFLLPFTKQYNHERELARSGRTPRFGSWKYSASKLAEKGVLVAWEGYDQSQWNRINLTVSSDEVGVFHLEGSMGSLMIPGASASVPLDDLLQAQFDGHQFMNLFKSGSAGVGAQGGEGLRLNVNLFLHLVFKKFYREE